MTLHNVNTEKSQFRRRVPSRFLCRVVWYKFTDVSEVPAVSIISAMAMEAVNTSEKSINLYQTTRHKNPADIQPFSQSPS
jgi:hypothetical protein